MATVIIDKNMDGDHVEIVLGQRTMSAQKHRPKTGPGFHHYAGSHADDEDYAHVLHLASQNEGLVLTEDGEMIEKAVEFHKELPKVGPPRCLRGVIVLPKGRERQQAVLRRLQAGEITIIASQSGVDAPRSIADVIDGNLGVDLRVENPRAIELCDCVWDRD